MEQTFSPITATKNSIRKYNMNKIIQLMEIIVLFRIGRGMIVELSNDISSLLLWF